MRDRLLDLDGVLNFRDFGGYDTPDGPLARGKLFRSASFHEATDADIARLEALGVRFLVDLRRPEERTTEPNRWPDRARTIFHEATAPDGLSVLPPHLAALLDNLTAEAVADYMRGIYREFPYDPRYIALYTAWFGKLSEGGPGVIHCAAGKDRTGLGCALTLLALGVGEDDVFADYEFTNQAVDIEARLPRIQASMEKRLARPLDPAALRPMLGVDSDYLHASLNEIRTRSGSVDVYLDEVLGVDAAARAKLHANLAA